MKKNILKILIICMSVTFALGIFAACDNADLIPSDSDTNQEQTIDDNGNNDNPTQDHTHVYNETVVNPTCTEQGYTLHSCTICSYDYKDTYTAALGHNYEWTTTKEPTETEKGVETGVCSRCKGTITRDIPELNHEHIYSETVIAPNCTDKGYTLHKCSCGAEYRTDETVALGHTPAAALEENRINATCTQNGSYDSVIRCSVCHTELSRENKIIPATGHEFTNYVSDGNATYDSDGTKTAYCNHGCGEKETVTDIGSQLVRSEITFNILTVNGSNVSGKVPNTQSIYYFTSEVSVYGNAKYTLSYDIGGNNTIASKTINLDVGDNTYYIVEYVDDEPQNIFTVTIRRRPVYTVSFNTDGGSAVKPQYIEEDYFAEEPTTAKEGYTFAGWDYDFNKAITKDTAVTASWVYYTFTAARNNDKAGTVTAYNETKITVGESVTITATTNDGYTFNGWYDGDDLLTNELSYSFTMPSENLFYTAHWTANTNIPYKAEYYLQNLANNEYTLHETDNLTGTTDTTAFATIKTYEHFTPTNSNISGKINGDGSTVLKVYYTRDKYAYTVTNDNLKGGIINCTQNGTYKYNKEIMLKVTVNDGYDFVGWYIDNKLLSSNLECAFNLTEKTDITAKWTAHTNTKYHVEYYLENLDGSFTKQDTEEKTGTTDTTATALIKTYEHFTHTVISQSNESDNINGDGSTVLQLYYTRNYYSVSIQAQNEHITLSSTYSGTYKYGYVIPSVNANEHLGYDWNGWFNDQGLITEEHSLPTIVVDRNIYYVANCVLKEEMVNFRFTSTTTTCNITGLRNIGSVIEIIVPDYVTDIACGAFSGTGLSSSMSLKSITIPFVGGSRKTARETYQYPFGYIFGVQQYPGMISTKQYYYGSSTSSTTSSTFYIPSSLESVTITGGNILYGAFYNCNNLRSITIGSSVTNIEDDAFYNCSGLLNVYYDGDVTSWCNISFGNIVSRPLYNKAFLYLKEDGEYKRVTDLVIPDSVTSIGDYVFYGCRGLNSVTIPDSTTSIGEWAFGNCAERLAGTSMFIGLKNVSIGNGVTNIGENAFYGCSNLSSIYYTGTASEWAQIDGLVNLTSSNRTLYINNEPLTNIVLEGITEIKSCAFRGCSDLEIVTIGNSVTSIGNSAFPGCISLTSITIPDSVTSIGNYAFKDCSSLTSVTIGNSVTSIGDYTFSGCSSLTSIAIPDSVTSIGQYAFYNCSGLTSVTVGNGVTSIGQYAFCGCDNLINITFSDDKGWYYISNIGNVSTNVTDASINATRFKSTHYIYNWHKK